MIHAASTARTLAIFAEEDTVGADATQAARVMTDTVATIAIVIAVMIAIEEIFAIVIMIALERMIAIGIAIETAAMTEIVAALAGEDTIRATTVALSPLIAEAVEEPPQWIAAMKGTGKERIRGKVKSVENAGPLDRNQNLKESNRSLISLTVENQEPAPKEHSQEPKEQAD